MRQNEVILLLDRSGKLVHSRSTPSCRKCLESCISESETITKCNIPGNHRRGLFKSDLGSTYLCTSDRDNISSSKLFKKQLRFYSEMLGSFNDIRNNIQEVGIKITRRVIHNLTSLHAHILQDLYLLVPQEVLTGSTDAKDQVRLVQEAFRDNEKELPTGYLRILKNAVAIKSEFNVFASLYSEKPTLNEKFHSIHRVLRNVSSMYFQDFQSKSVNIVQDDCKIDIFFDYETISVAFHHLFQNAVKYTQNNTTIRIRFQANAGVTEITLEMQSLPIGAEETELIFSDNYSGKSARQLSLAGDGTGLGIAKRLLEMNGASIQVNAGPAIYSRLGIAYATNAFNIKFPAKKIRRVN